MRRAVDVLVYGIATVFLGLGLLVLDSALVAVLTPSPENREILHDPNLAGLLTIAAFAVLGGAATIASRIRYVRQHPLLVRPTSDAAPTGGSPVILKPLDEMPEVSDRGVRADVWPIRGDAFVPWADPPAASAERSTAAPEVTGRSNAADIVGTGFGAAVLTAVLLVVVPIAFVLGDRALGIGGGLLVAIGLMAAGGQGFRLLYRMGRPAPSILGLGDIEPVPERRAVNPGWVIAGSVALTVVAMFALLVSICSSYRI